jgi:hypothetical protein
MVLETLAADAFAAAWFIRAVADFKISFLLAFFHD